MTTYEVHYDKWDKTRIKRQFSQLVALSWPIILQRLGIMTLGIVDTAMVARYSSEELAYQGLANSAIGSTLTVALLGLMMGTMVLTSNAYGAKNYKECGRVWRRALPYGFGVGFLGLLVCMFGEEILLTLGQTPEIARGGGEVIKVLAFGIMMLGPMLCCQFFLEGLSRPLPGMILMLVANVLNIGLNWMFVWGNLGFEPMGAVGSAWATTIVRTFLAVGLFTYIVLKLDREKYGLFENVELKWPVWRKQRHIGYAAGLTNTIEHLGFAALYIFAGYIGSLALGSLTIAFTIFGVPFMICYGVAAATSVRVGIAMGRGDHHDMALAGICGITYNGLLCIPMMFIMYFYPDTIISMFSEDAALIALTIPMMLLSIWMLFLDTAQTVMGNALRGAQDIWMPAVFYVICYSIVMIPLAWYLTFTLDRGTIGLIECVIVASLLSFVLLTSRFFYLTMVKKPTYER